MTPRPSLATKPRPSSAIYLGPPPLDIPDLPEPPSPVSSNGSGLPSPPATNSTGSGSTESTSAHDRDRPRPVSLTLSANMLNGTNIKTFQAAFAQNSHPKSNLKNQPHSSPDEYDEDDNDNDNDNDNDEDNTARLDRRHSLKTASENVIALQRVKSLTQRNRMVSVRVFISRYVPLTVPSYLHPRYICLPSQKNGSPTQLQCMLLLCYVIVHDHLRLLTNCPRFHA